MAAAAAPGVTAPEVPYAGVATRAVALAIDAVVGSYFVLYAERESSPAPQPALSRGRLGRFPG